MRIVTFLKNAPPYNPGETAGLKAAIAAKLVAEGNAVYAGQPAPSPKPAKPEPDVRKVAVSPQAGEPWDYVADGTPGTSAEVVEDDPATNDLDTVAIPANWRTITWMRRRGIAIRLGADRDTVTEAGAIVAIEAELTRRSKG